MSKYINSTSKLQYVDLDYAIDELQKLRKEHGNCTIDVVMSAEPYESEYPTVELVVKD